MTDLLDAHKPTNQEGDVVPEYEYAFRADDGPIIVATFGGMVTFDTYESAYRTGAKCYWQKLEILRRPKGDESAEWEPAPADVDGRDHAAT